MLHCNIALAAMTDRAGWATSYADLGEFRTMTKIIAALKGQSWVYMVGAFTILIFVGIATS